MTIYIKSDMPLEVCDCSGQTQEQLDADPYWQLLKNVRCQQVRKVKGGWLRYCLLRLLNGKKNVSINKEIE